MTNKISVASVIEKNRLSSDVPFLACLEIQIPDTLSGVILETLRYVNNTEDVVRNGLTYSAVQFSLELKAESGTTPQIMLSFFDFTKAVLAKLEQYKGGIGFNVNISVFAANNLSGPAEVTEYFTVVGASAANYEVTFTLGAENALTKQFPKRIQRRDFCQWIYKEPNTCRYSGTMTGCDHTLEGANGCRAHANTINFGACPNLVPSGTLFA